MGAEHVVSDSVLGLPDQPIHGRVEPGRERAILGAQHLRMRGWYSILGIEEELLVELFARPCPGKHDVDVTHLEPRKADEIVREIDDLDWLTHVQHEDLAALADGTRLQHQLHRLGDGHEVTPHLGMRDRDRAAVLDLPQKGGHHAPPAPQDVAKPHRDEVLPVLLRDPLHDLLRHTLGRAHDVGGAHRLVGRDQHEMLGPELGRELSDVPGAEHVVCHRLAGVGLHEGHMLVRRGMEDCIWGEAHEDLLHPTPVPDIGDDRDAREVGREAPQLVQDVENRVLAVAQQDEAGWLEAGELAAQLAPDGTARARHQHGLSGRESAHLAQIGVNRLAAQQVLDLHLPKGGHGHAARQDVEHAGNGSGTSAGCGRSVQYLAHHPARGPGHRDDHFLRVVPGNERGEVGKVAQHRKVEHALPMFPFVLVDEPDRLESQLGMAQQFLADQFTRRSSSRDDHALDMPVVTTHGAPTQHSHPETGDGGRDRRQEDVEEEDRHRHPDRDRMDRRENQRAQQCAGDPDKGHGDNEPLHLDHAGVSPEPVVNPSEIADGDLEGHRDQQIRQRGGAIGLGPCDALEPERERHEGRGTEEEGVREDEVTIAYCWSCRPGVCHWSEGWLGNIGTSRTCRIGCCVDHN